MKSIILFFGIFIPFLTYADKAPYSERMIIRYDNETEISFIANSIKNSNYQLTGITIENLSCEKSKADIIKEKFIQYGVYTQFNIFPEPARFCNDEPNYLITIESL